MKKLIAIAAVICAAVVTSAAAQAAVHDPSRASCAHLTHDIQTLTVLRGKALGTAGQYRIEAQTADDQEERLLDRTWTLVWHQVAISDLWEIRDFQAWQYAKLCRP